jgi:hypothetical protein
VNLKPGDRIPLTVAREHLRGFAAGGRRIY